MANDKDKNCKNDTKECSSANNSIAEFVEATSVDEPTGPDTVDKTTEVSPMDKGAEDDEEGPAQTKKPEASDEKDDDAPAPAENESNNLQEIAGNIGRPDSKVTSNSPKKEEEAAEHVDLGKSA